MLKMVLHYSHSRMGGNNTAHFEPGTIYIVTVGALPLSRSRYGVAQMLVITNSRACTHTCTDTHTHSCI